MQTFKVIFCGDWNDEVRMDRFAVVDAVSPLSAMEQVQSFLDSMAAKGADPVVIGAIPM